MSHSIWIPTKFMEQERFVKMNEKHGSRGVLGVLGLWMWTARNRPSGRLAGLDEKQVLAACELPVEVPYAPGYYQDLIDFGFLSEDGATVQGWDKVFDD